MADSVMGRDNVVWVFLRNERETRQGKKRGEEGEIKTV